MSKLILPRNLAVTPEASPTLIIPGRGDAGADQQHFGLEDRIAVDADRFHFEHIVKNIRARGVWFMEPTGFVGETAKPALVLLPKRLKRMKKKERGKLPLIRGMDLYLWTPPEEYGDAVYAAMEARKFCAFLGLNPMRTDDVMEIIMLVNRCIPDIQHMPPEPPAPERIVAEITGVIGDDVIEQEVSDRV